MQLHRIDIVIIGALMAVILLVGLLTARRSSASGAQYFLSGRNMPWWMLGLSMVATTFSADTPNLVTDIVRQNGVAGNWVWWAFLLTGLLTTFVYAKLWRHSGFDTDNQFYEARYEGKPGRFLRGFRAVYLGLFFNVLVLATVSMAAIKIGQVVLGWEAWQTIGVAAIITMAFSVLGGLRGVIYTDIILFVLAMTGSVAAAYFALSHPAVGGLQGLLQHEVVSQKISFLPNLKDAQEWVPLLFIPLAVQWWAAWYPGAEPGGGGYIAQRMLAAKNANHALGATLLFNIMHYAVRPWPWILVGLASLVLYPTLASIQAAFPSVADAQLGHDLGYSAMLVFLPAGWLGLVIASLLAAFISTLSTHLNWGASYLTLDVYARFINPSATPKEKVNVGRVITALSMVAGALLGVYLDSAKEVFDIIILFGAGTGLVFILRWFWRRINAWTEITAMLASGVLSLVIKSPGVYPEYLPDWGQFPIVVGVSTLLWLAVTLLTQPVSKAHWQAFQQRTKSHTVRWPIALALFFAASVGIYGLLFTTGFLLYGQYLSAVVTGGVSLLGGLLVLKMLTANQQH